MDIEHVTLLLSVVTSILSLCAIIIAFFTKRQFTVYDATVKESTQNKADIEVIKVKVDRLEEDAMKADDRFEEVKSFIAEQVKGLSREIKALEKIVTEIRINCAAVGHVELVKPKKQDLE